MSRYLVTGGAGFIGSNIVERLTRDGHDVVVLDNLSTGREENLRSFERDIRFIRGDVRYMPTCRVAVEGVDFILHQAALGSVSRSIADPVATNDNNVCGTLNVLVAARDAGVQRVVVASSSSVYGNSEVLPKVEDMRPRPRSPYAVSKLAEECYAQAFWVSYGLSTVALRYSNVFGPRQRSDGAYAAVIPQFIEAGLDGRSLTIYGDGKQSRDFTYVENVVEANLLACQAGEHASGGVCNIGTGAETSLLGLVLSLGRMLGREGSLECVHEEGRPGDIWHSRVDVARAKQLIGYSPEVNLDEGLRRTVEWFSARTAA